MRRRDGACRAGRGRRDGMARHRRRHRVLPADLLLFLFALPSAASALLYWPSAPPWQPGAGPCAMAQCAPSPSRSHRASPALLSFLRSYIYPEASRVRTPLGFSPDDHACTLTHPRLVAGPDSGPPSRALGVRPSPASTWSHEQSLASPLPAARRARSIAHARPAASSPTDRPISPRRVAPQQPFLLTSKHHPTRYRHELSTTGVA